jgi:hypothetical protein
MAYNKITLNGETKIDLTQDTVTAEDVALGKIFHLNSGEQAVGTLEITSGGGSEEVITETFTSFSNAFNLIKEKFNNGKLFRVIATEKTYSPDFTVFLIKSGSVTEKSYKDIITFTAGRKAYLMPSFYYTYSGNTFYTFRGCTSGGVTVEVSTTNGENWQGKINSVFYKDSAVAISPYQCSVSMSNVYSKVEVQYFE